jgi:tetratricopeptide (TPR) repeat protein
MKIRIQDPVPYEQSVQWQIQDAYFAERGVAAWYDGDLPYLATSSRAAAQQQVGFLLAHLSTLGERPRFDILEVGGGHGAFCANFLRVLDESKSDLAGRVRYIFSDYAAKTVGEAASGPELRAAVAAGRVVPALCDLRRPEAPVALDGKPLEIKAAAVLASYVCDVMSPLVVRRVPEGWQRLHVSVDLEAEAETDRELLLSELLRAGATPGLLDKLQTEHHWRSWELPADAHAALLERHAGIDGTVAYPTAFFDFLAGSASLLAPGGVVVVNDLGTVERVSRVPKPLHYGNAIAHEVDFTLFDTLSEVSEWRVLRMNNPLRSLHTAVLMRNELPAATAQAFHHWFVERQDAQDLLDFSAAARLCAERKEWSRAIRHLERCLELDGGHMELLSRAGDACIESGHHRRAVEHLRRGLLLDESERHDFHFQLGRAHAGLHEYDAAAAHYEKSLVRESHHVTWSNLGFVYEKLGRMDEACLAYRRALAIRPGHGRAQDGLDRLKDRWWEELLQQLEAEQNPAAGLSQGPGPR